MRYLARKSLIFSPNLQFSNSIRIGFLREFLSRKKSRSSLRLFPMADEVTYLGARNPSQLNKRFICIIIYIYNPPSFLESEAMVSSQDISLGLSESWVLDMFPGSSSPVPPVWIRWGRVPSKGRPEDWHDVKFLKLNLRKTHKERQLRRTSEQQPS